MPLVNCAIICGDSRDRLTRQCIESLYSTHRIAEADVTILANAVAPGTREMLDELMDRYQFNLVVSPERLGGGEVTNRVLSAARVNRGRFLYHTSNDFYFSPGWLDSLISNWPICEAMGIGLLGAYSHPYHRPKFATRGIGGYDIVERDMVAGGSWFMEWETWERYGPLNEQHKGLWIGSEDTEFNMRLITAGIGRATLVPEGVIHTGRTTSDGRPTLGAEYMYDVPGVIIE